MFKKIKLFFNWIDFGKFRTGMTRIVPHNIKTKMKTNQKINMIWIASEWYKHLWCQHENVKIYKYFDKDSKMAWFQTTPFHINWLVWNENKNFIVCSEIVISNKRYLDEPHKYAPQ